MTSDDKKDDADQVTGLSLDDSDNEANATPEEHGAAASSKPEDERTLADHAHDIIDVESDDATEESAITRAPILDDAAVLSAGRTDVQGAATQDEVYEDDFDVDVEALDDETVDDMEADVHITGDESLDFADDADDGVDPVLAANAGAAAANKKGGSLKFVAPVAVLLLAAGVGGYIVMNPAILGGGSNDATIVAPTIVAPPELQEDMAALDDANVPQPLASENTVPRMPESSEALAGNLEGEDSFAAIEDVAEPVPEPVIEEPAAEAFPADLEQELAALEANTEAAEAVAEEEPAEGVTEQGSADVSDLEPPVLEVPDNGAVAADDEPVLDLTESNTPAEPEPIQLAQAETAQEEMPLMPAADTQPQKPYQETVSDTAQAAQTEQSKPLIKSASDTYYDGGSGSTLPPVGNQNATAGLRAIDPVTEPASQYVVVNKDRGASDYESMLVAAKRALKLKRYDSALEMYDSLYAKNKRDPRVLMGLAVAQQNSGMTEAALQTYDDLLALDKNNADAMLNMLGLLKKQYPAVALRRLLELHQDYPRNAMIAAQLGVTYADQGDYDQAFRYLGIASSIEPDNAQHLFNIAIIADRAGKRTEAVKYYEKALEADAVYGGGRTIPRETIYDRLSVLRR